MSDKKFTASEVAEVLENHTWESQWTRTHDYVEGKWQVLDSPRMETQMREFSWDDIYGGERFDTSIGRIEVVEVDSGGEGHGESIYAVVKVVETGQLFRMNGSYMSHYGSEWDGDLYPVTAVERTVVFYE